jgi:valyl-tRNA synthetase
MTTYATGQIPFKKVYLHGLIRTRDGAKMSKSHPETCIDPLKVIDTYGADALRLSMIVGQSPGNESRLFEEKIGGYRNFINKLWNASRFVLMQCEAAGCDPAELKMNNGKLKMTSLADKALLSASQDLITDVTAGLEAYRLSEVGERLYSFVWDYFCDWYLELSKGEANPQVLIHALRTILQLLHPYCPFVTEELWKSVAPEGATLLLKGAWPQADDSLKNQVAFDQLQVVIDVITAIRSIRAEQGVDQGKKIEAIIHTKEHAKLLESQRGHIERLGRLEKLMIDAKSAKHKNAASVFLKGVEVHIPLEGMIDMDAEKQKLTKEQENLRGFLAGVEKKLSNEQFVAHAPAEVLAKERQKLTDAQEKLKKVEERLKLLS